MTGPGVPDAAGDGPAAAPDLVAGSLRGYRTWHLLPRGAASPPGALPLTSVTRPHVVWHPQLRAQCAALDARTDLHGSPDPSCTCGIYAWYVPADTVDYAAEVFGAVEASGRVLMGTRGFRAETVRITAVATRNRRLAAACTAAGVAVYRRRRDLLAHHPPDDVEALVGEPAVTTPRWRPRGFGLAIGLSMALRALVLVVAAGAVPAGIAMAGLLVTELTVFGIVVRLLRG